MMSRLKIFNKTTYLTLILTLTACGGGGGGGSNTVAYSGNTSPAAITSTNAQSIGSGSAEGATQSVNSYVANQNNPLAITAANTTTSVPAMVTDAVKSVAAASQPVNNLPLAATISYTDLNTQMGSNLFCGGSVSYPDNYNGTGPITMSFNNLCVDMSVVGAGQTGQMTMNGKVTLSDPNSTTTFSVTYTNFVATYNGATYTLNGTYSCTSTGCSFSQDFVSSSGDTYRVSNVSVTGDSTSGFYVDATFYHSTYGSVTVSTTSPLTFNCPNGYPDSGTLSFSGTVGSGTITFLSDCSGYTGTYDDGTTTGTFSGTW